MTFYPYRRQERKTRGGEPVSAELVAKLMEAAGVNRVVTLDIHSEKILKFFRIPVKNLTAADLFVDYFQKKIKTGNKSEWLVVYPDEGDFSRSRLFARRLNLPLLLVKKSRGGKHDVVTKVKLTTPVRNKNTFIFDDEINAGGTFFENVKLLKKFGAQDIYFSFTHAILSGQAVSRVRKTLVKEVIITDSIYQTSEKRLKKIKILSCAPIFAQIIRKLV